LLALTAALSLGMAGIACDNTARGVEQDTAEAADDARDATAAARAEADDEADDARRTAREAGSAIDAAGETLDVKAALMVDDLVDASGINVDTFHETKTVVLKGSVPSEAQKTAAGRIAQREAEGYKIDNQLTVRMP
jgi:osmotically-inducible protein OsmY